MTCTTIDRDFIRIGPSRISGTGAFAKRRIHRGARIIEYTGERVPMGQVDSVYGLVLDLETVIDGARGGNEARFVNHSCAPNCETYVFDGRAYLYAMRDIARGEELTFDYRLGPPPGAPQPDQDAAAYRCQCGAATCRGTLLTPIGDLT